MIIDDYNGYRDYGDDVKDKEDSYLVRIEIELSAVVSVMLCFIVALLL